MHQTAMRNGARFFDVYVKKITAPTIVEIGARNVNGSLRSIVPEQVKYVGVDLVAAPSVDVVLEDPYKLPFEDNSIDAVVCSSCFEHAEFFWETFLEIQRVLKPDGLFYMNAPSNGDFHRYPVDCWRFYPDSGVALARWAQRKGYRTTLLESYTGRQEDDIWADQICIFVKDSSMASRYPDRITANFSAFNNGISYPQLDIYLNEQSRSQDQRRAVIWHFTQRARRAIKRVMARV